MEIGAVDGHAQAVLAATPEIMAIVREPVVGRRLIHVGVLIEPVWIEASGLASEADRISRCGREFGLHAWQPSRRMAWIARSMFNSQQTSLDRLKLESETLDLLAEAFRSFQTDRPQIGITPLTRRRMQAMRERIEAEPAVLQDRIRSQSVRSSAQLPPRTRP
jgi:hypothetical protein